MNALRRICGFAEYFDLTHRLLEQPAVLFDADRLTVNGNVTFAAANLVRGTGLTTTATPLPARWRSASRCGRSSGFLQ